MKKKMLFLTVTLALIVIVNCKTTSVSAANNPIENYLTATNMKKSAQISNQTKKINQTINRRLYKNVNAVTKVLDEEKSLSKKKLSNIQQYWSQFVKKINYLKNSQLEIYVTSNFKELSQNSRREVIAMAQHLTLDCLESYRAVTREEHLEGLFAHIFCDGTALGRTEFLNHKDLIWHD
ncbi:hypothetical protein [Companilactobacillus halodurans]|uniref:Lipoprotein n=1 Tax=Companilactobacillus halodurans TaxID=2584183 RepID=A0A5P0ZM20_9LACO|nr:hypothetical protein [Companilactobacillus halodurans]MQS75159.1 hypothetical protein [Companilactobacillus halodurans]MQS97576.1 hypothetical protein [Companilactobacillus halodurans]